MVLRVILLLILLYKIKGFTFQTPNYLIIINDIKVIKVIIHNYMTETNNLIKNIVVDIIITTTIWGLLNNNTYKYFFGLGVSIYILQKYI